MKRWIFQANPSHYDIAAALDAIDEICWRVPQYTEEVSVGDEVAIWRSGADAGVVGIGTVASPPAMHDVPALERPFVLNGEVEGASETRVRLLTAPVDFVEKAQFAEDVVLAGHQIIRAPMGTVFRLSDDEWAALAVLLSASPPSLDTSTPDEDTKYPAPFSWKDRRKDTYPLPGGYDGYLLSLDRILDVVQRKRPSVDGLTADLQTSFGSSPTNARHISLFLRRSGFLVEQAGLIALSPVGEQYLTSKDPSLVIAQLHSRIRFVGEMLAVLDHPMTLDEIRQVANDDYSMGWTTQAQIQRRRGWFQSAGLVEPDDSGRLVRTASGEELLANLIVHPKIAPETEGSRPPEEPPSIAPVEPTEPAPEQPATRTVASELIDRLVRTSTDSGSPDDFEFAVRDVFAFLGFRAEKLGGAGKTDVVADADLGFGASYRVIIDGKTTGRGAVMDQQIDWDTIDDHRRQHDADYVVIAGPVFSGARLVSRAAAHNVVLMTTSDLTDLVRLHASVPLSLDAFRPLFAADGGEADLEALTDAVEETERFTEVVANVLVQIEEHVSEVGALSSRDLFLLLRNSTDLDAEEAEISAALTSLANPLVAMLVESDGQFRPSGPRATALRRLELLADLFAKQLPPGPEGTATS